MRIKISVIGEGVKIGEDLSRVAEVTDDVRGADVVVLAGNGDLEAIARSAPAAAVVVSANPLEKRCREVYEETLFPRARIVGVADPERVSAAVEAIVFDSGASHEVVALRAGEFAGGRARLGRGGIRELI